MKKKIHDAFRSFLNDMSVLHYNSQHLHNAIDEAHSKERTFSGMRFSFPQLTLKGEGKLETYCISEPQSTSSTEEFQNLRRDLHACVSEWVVGRIWDAFCFHFSVSIDNYSEWVDFLKEHSGVVKGRGRFDALTSVGITRNGKTFVLPNDLLELRRCFAHEERRRQLKSSQAKKCFDDFNSGNKYDEWAIEYMTGYAYYLYRKFCDTQNANPIIEMDTGTYLTEDEMRRVEEMVDRIKSAIMAGKKVTLSVKVPHQNR